MIKAIVTDVDGVIVGTKKGVNFPLPSESVTQILKELNKKGIPVILNTAKYNKAILEITKKAELHNPQISDGGAVINDPLASKFIAKHVLGKLLAKKIIKASLDHGFYTEFNAVNDWFVQRDQIGTFTDKRAAILQAPNITVDSLVDQVDNVDVIKIYTFIHNPDEKKIVDTMLEPFKDQVNIIWSHHPTTFPSQNTIVTVKGISKKSATLEVLNYLHISPDDTLGVGDTLGDWNFMEVCGYVGVTGGQSKELIELAKSKGTGKFFIADDADHDGFLDIIKHFDM